MKARSFVNDVQNIMNTQLSHGNKLADIHEKGQEKILFKGCGSYIVYSLDPNNHDGLVGFNPFPFFSNAEKKLNAVNDYIIFAEHPKSKELFIIVIELKQKKNPYVQLWAGRHFCEFVVKRLNATCCTNYSPTIRMIGSVSASHKAAIKVDTVKYNDKGMCLKHFKTLILEDLLH